MVPSSLQTSWKTTPVSLVSPVTAVPCLIQENKLLWIPCIKMQPWEIFEWCRLWTNHKQFTGKRSEVEQKEERWPFVMQVICINLVAITIQIPFAKQFLSHFYHEAFFSVLQIYCCVGATFCCCGFVLFLLSWILLRSGWFKGGHIFLLLFLQWLFFRHYQYWCYYHGSRFQWVTLIPLWLLLGQLI